MARFLLYNFGAKGVNVDKAPFELDDAELVKSQNGTRDPATKGFTNRPGIEPINTDEAAGVVLGGIGVPLLDLSSAGTHFFFIGRGPSS
jgi:hypothetical protein